MHKPLLLTFACAFGALLLLSKGVDAQKCDDVSPTEDTCEQEKDWGKCDAVWMKGYCLKTCGGCQESSSEDTEDTDSNTETSSQTKSTEASPAEECIDIEPPGNYTCAEQAEYEKCDEKWMVAGDFCAATCKRCTPSAEDEEPGEESTTTVSPAAATEEEGAEGAEGEGAEEPAAVPAAEAYRTALTDVATELGSDTINDNLVIQPIELASISLAQQDPQPATAAPAPAAVPPVEVLPVETQLLELLAPSPEEEGPEEPVAAASAAGDACETEPTAYSVLMNDPELSTLRQAVEVLNLASVLQNPDIKFTMFAPTDTAFNNAVAALGGTPNQLLSSRNLLRDIVFTHIIPNQILTAETIAASPTLSPESRSIVYVRPGPMGVMLVSVGSNAQVSGPDYASACNYVMHKVDGVLLPNPGPRTGINPAYQSAVAGSGIGVAGPAGR